MDEEDVEVFEDDVVRGVVDENDYFIVSLRTRLDFLTALSDGPWIIFRHYLTVEPWSPDFSSSQLFPRRIVAWIRLPGLPVTLYKRSLITEIGECIRKVVKIDYQIETGCRGRFARMEVSVDLGKLLTLKILINGRVQIVEYESLPTICFSCDRYRHVKDIYPENTVEDQQESATPKEQVTHSLSLAPQAQSSKAHSNDHHVAKSKTTFHVCKPLTIPKVTARSSKGYYRQSSHQPRQNTVEPRVSILDRSKHLTIVLSENTNPNTADDIISYTTQGNSQHKLIPRKPPDTNQAQGCGHPHFLLVFRQYLRDFKPDLVAIFEPRISGGRADVFINATRKNCATTTRHCRYFQDFVYDFGIRYMGFQGPEFTWNMGLSYAHLDRALCNSKWDESYPETAVHHLHRMWSDHRPLLLCVGSPMDNICPSQFRYFSGWLQHDDFSRMVEDNWVKCETLSGTMFYFSEAADTWNKTMFGYIGTKNKIIMARLQGVHRSLNSFHSNFLINLEAELLIELKKLLDQEETLWKQRSRGSMAITPNDMENFEALKDMAPLKAPGHDGLHAKFFQKQWHVVSYSVCSMVKKVFAGDLEKAFDRLRLDFIQDSLTNACFPVSTIRVIMHCITSASMQIQWNGEYTPDFKPQRCIRQGDSLSPYLFVLAMKRLGHSIRKCVEEGDWKRFSFARQGLPINHLFFANDLMLYAKADLPHARQIEKILNQLGYFSGHKVSKRKTHIYFSPNTVTKTKTVILSCLGFQEVDHMGKYLGVPVLHSRMKAVDFDFIFDKFRGKLNGWAARTLSLAGRVTLAKSILSAIPTYFIYARANAHVHPTQKLYNFISEQNHWDVEELSQVLVPVAIPHVLNVRPPEATDIFDALVWKWDPEHQFMIKSTYTILMEDSWSGKNNVWKNIWSITTLQRVCMFIWLAYKKKIMTNYEHGIRMMTNDCSCATCGATMESVIHVLRDYPPSRNLWLRVVPHSAFASFFGIDLQSWITQNIQKQQPGATYKTDSTIHSSYNWAKCYTNSSKVPFIYPVQHMTNPTWSPPPRGWMSLNTDGAVVTLDGGGSIGGVIHNSNGEWITGFTKNIGTTSILHAELWSIYEGLLIARNLGIHSNIITWFTLAPPDELANLLALDAAVAQQTDENIVPIVCVAIREDRWRASHLLGVVNRLLLRL
ncbi:hypothetical protein F3Y22_tig00111743pilonHSYRG00079 [Hibiscus syriacus]|uniref:Reverse transcriptase domain-containing protein n=1 Tax=Hibiscus syriacus TaxID=106335 RepID=A0A6A2XGM4_HIBSY|nr:hypothetical protein F3Y22_tig00111743pilonHSYRG00079 [Hibiscus syriacus]